MVAIATEWVKGHSGLSLGGLQQAGAGIEGLGGRRLQSSFLFSLCPEWCWKETLKWESPRTSDLQHPGNQGSCSALFSPVKMHSQGRSPSSIIELIVLG